MSLAITLEASVLDALNKSGRIGDSGIQVNRQKVFKIDGHDRPLKSMLESFEVSLLYVLARDHYSGSGHIVDAGCLFGLSTIALASGIRQNPNGLQQTLPIQSFDLFEVNPPYDKFAEDFHTFGATSNALGTFLEFNSRNLDLVLPHQGDFKNWDWKSEFPIELIFNDLSKSVDLNNHMFQTFVSKMIPGKGFLFQQDYVHFAEWWIAVSMEYFADEFEELGYYFGATKLYRLKQNSTCDFSNFDIRDLSHDTIENLLLRAIQRAPITVREVLQTALGMFMVDTGRYDRALEVVLPMRLGEEEMSVLLNAPIPSHENFAPILPSNRRKVIEYARNRVQTAGTGF